MRDPHLIRHPHAPHHPGPRALATACLALGLAAATAAPARAANECGNLGGPCCLVAENPPGYNSYCNLGHTCDQSTFICVFAVNASFATQPVWSGNFSGGGGDEDLTDPWGIVPQANATYLVANRDSGLVTAYTDDTAFGPAIALGSRPTAGVRNEGDAFYISAGGISVPAGTLWASEEGRIYGAEPGLKLVSTGVVLIDRSKAGASFTGLALVTTKSAVSDRLYAADFARGVIEVWDGNLRRVNIAGDFVAPNIPRLLSPYGIHAVDGMIVVTYAQADRKRGGVDPRAGRVALFDTEGRFLDELDHGHLAAPWGVARSPSSGFGDLNACLLIANTGDGRIHAFCRDRQGTFGKGRPLDGISGKPLEIDGLRGLAFVEDAGKGEGPTLHYSARYLLGGLGAVIGVIQHGLKWRCNCRCENQDTGMVHLLSQIILATPPNQMQQCSFACSEVLPNPPFLCTAY